MANQVGARLKGDDYQHLFAWFHSLELKMPRKKVAVVRVEDPDAASVDDVTVRGAPDSLLPERFHQIKFHVTLGGSYSTASLLDRQNGESSLLEKLYRSWKELQRADPNRSIEIYLVSNWSWDPTDAIATCISGDDNSLIDHFFSVSDRTKVGRLRKQWQDHLGASPTEFAAFCRMLRLEVGFNCWERMKTATADRMDSLGLKSDEAALKLAVGIVRDWVKSRRVDIDLTALEAVLAQHDLYAAKAEAAVNVHLTTIKEQAFDIDPDFTVDWRDHFLGTANKRGHQLQNPQDWNTLLLPELLDVETEINQQRAKLVRVRGKARLCAWFAFGHTFSAPNGYTIEIEQNGALWLSDAQPDAKFSVASHMGDWSGETLRDGGDAVAVAISVTASLADDVRRDVLEHRADVSALLHLQPTCSPGPNCVTSQHDVTALADCVKAALREFCRVRNAKRLLVYYCGPISGACFIGHRLNAVCPETLIMEYDQAERAYHPSFLLT